MPTRIAIVGGGLSGVATAYFLQNQGFHPEIIEAESRLGGRAGSAMLGSRNIDIGGKNIGRKYHLFRQFAHDIGSAEFEFFGINSSILKNGRLHTVDSEKKLTSALHLLRLIGLRDAAKLARLAGVVKCTPQESLLGGPFFSRLSERSDHRALSEWFGQDCTDSFLRPMILRMNGAEPEEYYLGCLGSNLKMMLDKYDQLTEGMSRLLARFERKSRTRLGTRVTALDFEPSPGGAGKIRLRLSQNQNDQWQQYDFVVIALPAHQAALLLSAEPIAEELRRVTYNPVTLIVARYERPVFDSKVRAIVFGRESIVSNAGAYGCNDLDTVRYTLSGKTAREMCGRLSDEELLAEAERTLRKHLSTDSGACVEFVCRRFDHGLCSYSAYHHHLIDRIKNWEHRVGSVALAGDYFYGASIEACFSAGERCAHRVSRLFASNSRVSDASSHNGRHVVPAREASRPSAPLEIH